MSNCMFGYPNRGDAGALSGGAWYGALPLANLQNRVLAKKARTTDLALASTQFTCDLGAGKSIRIAALINHNLSLLARFRLRASNAADFSPTVYDSGWRDVWPAVYLPESIDWEEDNWWSGKYTAEEIVGIYWKLIHVLPANARARYWRLELNDQLNAAGYVEAGRFFLCPVWQPAKNLSRGSSFGWDTDTQSERTQGGALYFDRRIPRRVVRISLDWLTTDEGFSSADELVRRAGIDGEILYVHDPADTLHAIRRQFLGHMRQLSPLEAPYFNVTKMPFEIEELL